MNIIRLALGDLKRFVKDWQAAMWLLAMPLVFAYIFGSAMHGGGPPATWIPVIDLDRSGLSELFVEQLRQPGYWIEMKGAETQAQLKTDWPYGLVIPAGFGSAILEGKPVKVTLVKGQVAPDKLLEVQSCLMHAVVRYTKALVLADTSHKEWNDGPEAPATPDPFSPVRAHIETAAYGILSKPTRDAGHVCHADDHHLRRSQPGQ